MQKKKKIRMLKKVLIFFSLSILCGLGFRQEIQASLWENPYFTFSPDGLAFTTNAGDRNIEQYQNGHTVYTGIESTLQNPQKGEHLYSDIVTGNVRVVKCVVEYR